MVHTLAYKVLNMLMFSNIDLLILKFKLALIFQQTNKILQDEIYMPSLQVVQVVTKPSTRKDLIKLQTKLVVETIAIFDEGYLKDTNINLSSDMLLATWIEFLFIVLIRSASEYQNLCLEVVQLVNDNNVLVARTTSGNITHATFLYIMIDFGAQPIMIHMQFVQE